METPVSPPTPPNPPYAPYAPPAAPPKSKTPVVVVALLGACGCGLLMIPILAAILFPVFAQAREKARQVSCLSNEKQMALGVMMYAQDYDETYPTAPQWITQIDPYVKNPSVYACPSAASRAQIQQGGVYTYAYNSQMSKRAIALLKAPQLTGILYNSVAMTQNASDALTSLPFPVGIRDGTTWHLETDTPNPWTACKCRYFRRRSPRYSRNPTRSAEGT